MPTNQEGWAMSEKDMKALGISDTKDNETLKDQLSKTLGDLQSEKEPSSSSIGPLSSGPMVVKSNLKSYIGTKVIIARPMSDSEFQITIKGKSAEEVKNQESQGDGYEVTYEDGYISWSPKGVFERCYREITNQEKGLIQTAIYSPKQ